MTWFAQLPDSAKAWMAALGTLALVFSAGGTAALTLSGYRAIPNRVTAHERRIHALEEFQRFAGCWMLETGSGRNPDPCRYLLTNPEQFRPPYNGDAQ